MGDGLIHFVCISREHYSGSEPGLTQHLGEWAICTELLGRGHDWFDTDGVSVREAVAQWRRLMGAPEARPVPAA